MVLRKPRRETGGGQAREQALGSNRKYQQFYDRIAFFYDAYITLTAVLVRRRSWRKARGELTAELGVVPSGGRILEVGIGTGLNLEILPRDLEYWGVDISSRMLRRCRRRSRRLGRPVHLFQAEAEALLFQDRTFDAVFTVGGFNFFRDKSAAIQELIRVAKPGARVLIVDETEQYVRKVYERTPLARATFKGEDAGSMQAPMDLVPPAMRELRCVSLWDGRFYCVSFVTPQEP
jgi:ubiquinone/menaquinone biosynthesis C-methylase UbiE